MGKDLIVIALVPGVPLQQQAGIELRPPAGGSAPVRGDREVNGPHHDPVPFHQAVQDAALRVDDRAHPR